MQISKLIEECEEKCLNRFKILEKTALYNQKKVLDAFRGNRIALRHFAPTTGYAYDDLGRTTLSRVFADVFCAEDAIVSPLFASGTHTIAVALFGLLRPGQNILSITGDPYNTLKKVIGGQNCEKRNENNIGSLSDFNIGFHCVGLNEDGSFDNDAIAVSIKKINPDAFYIQRAKGYAWRRALSIEAIKDVIQKIRKFSDAPVIVDNCYGEFIDKKEPLEVGANLIMGSLIKNPGGGLAPTGGYIVGDKSLLQSIEGRYSAPGVGFEIGAYPFGYQYFFQGLFMAPHTVLQAAKAALLFSEVFFALDYQVLGYGELPTDITCAIRLKTSEELIEFCRAVQFSSPIDSFAVACPNDMPGYNNPIIMAGGTFVQGSSIELSADAPVVEPYIAYMQGSLTYEHAKIALIEIINTLRKTN